MRNVAKSLKIRQGSLLADAVIILIMSSAAFFSLLPIINVLAVSLSSSAKAAAGIVRLWPVDFTLSSYEYALTKPQFLRSFGVSVQRVAFGLAVNMVCTVLVAYPLSKTKKELFGRNAYAWFFFFTMIFSGGLVPWYVVVKQTGLLNSIWGLIIPGAVPVFNVIVLLNFFRQLPKELSESAWVDGAGHMLILTRIYLPLSIPSLATLVLLVAVSHWNNWFDGLILLQSPDKYPLQTYLRSLLISRSMESMTHASPEELKALRSISDRTLKAAQIFISALPVLAAYPFLQKYFMKGLVLGSVKG
ncbi:MAG: carbohydrate ABC transporter permease [Clostridiales bacterium]|jgi:putative aldouronate transport system permease protein|nr:carbohydrate ABC transporter permease [Clostridiales bacterium]